jgi:hypothetical protein
MNLPQIKPPLYEEILTKKEEGITSSRRSDTDLREMKFILFCFSILVYTLKH